MSIQVGTIKKGVLLVRGAQIVFDRVAIRTAPEHNCHVSNVGLRSLMDTYGFLHGHFEDHCGDRVPA